MNLQEFKLRKPEFVKEASYCDNEEDFIRIAEKHGIKFGKDCLEKAFNTFSKSISSEKNDDDLEQVSGGANSGQELSFTSLGLGGDRNTFLVTSL